MRAVSEENFWQVLNVTLHLFPVDIRTGKKEPLHLRDIKPVHATEKLTKLLFSHIYRSTQNYASTLGSGLTMMKVSSLYLWASFVFDIKVDFLFEE